MSFSPLVPIALFGWIPVVIAIFATVRVRHRAVIIAYVVAWLFLPMAKIKVPGFVDYSKITATGFGILLAALLFDIPMALFVGSPFFTSVSNELGYYDGLSAVFEMFASWGVPYFIGRIYFNRVEHLRDLAIGIFVGGLIYVPFCLYEIKQSPQLHKMIYGYHQHQFGQTKRWGGFRPMVFMQHGLAVGMWMGMATMLGAWMWMVGRVKELNRMPMVVLVVFMGVTFVLCKSTTALLLTAMGMAALYSGWILRTWLALLVLVALPPIYGITRASMAWNGEGVYEFAQSVTGTQRADSIGFRIMNENMLAEKALERPWLGWGRWNRAHVFNAAGKDITIADAMWIIIFGQQGYVGLVVWLVVMAQPLLKVWWFAERSHKIPQHLAHMLPLAMLVFVYQADSLLNGMLNPIFIMVMGGVLCAPMRLKAPMTVGMLQRLAAISSANRAALQAVGGRPTRGPVQPVRRVESHEVT
jgi:hypothetical protein